MAALKKRDFNEALAIIGVESPSDAYHENMEYLFDYIDGEVAPAPTSIEEIWKQEAPYFFITMRSVDGLPLIIPGRLRRLIIDRTAQYNQNALVPGNLVIKAVPANEDTIKRLIAYCKRAGIPMQVDKPPPKRTL